ncbi:class I adenylate-forming enzyme family protein [Natronorubrum daqingense]|uniref:AMP-dependent synthetase n=1 Tax=Natronorubrum daqingense TaxID=588898 RepID=A0A1N7FIN2_9EURY|nr:class I adenylate-forming enzyme family protein [Natronorubrum daqingense]APX98475.1 AMP-dependent synthetase [Natronorubrum daqingense]SIS00150.1 fatty-acyl-CoA synthase [Natronorubrum daqingense]
MLAWPEETIYEALEAVASTHPEKSAVVGPDTDRTYATLLEESRSLAAGLADLGVGAGDVVAVWLGNRPEWVACQLATSVLGAAMVAVNTRYRTHELEYMLTDSSASVLVTEESLLGRNYHEMVESTVPEVATQSPSTFDPDSIPTLDAVVSLESDPRRPAIRDYEDVVGEGRSRVSNADLEPASDPAATAAIFYTSGTTSDPKGCLQSNRSLVNHSAHVAAHLGITETDVGVATLPFCGIWGYNTVFAHLLAGATLVTQTHFDPERTIDLVDDHDATSLSGLGVMFERMLATADFARSRVDTLERGVVGFISKGFDEPLFERIEDAFGFPVVQPYGLSEANSQLFVGDPAAPMAKRKRVGGPPVHPEIEVRIVDPETRADRPTGEAGELALRGYPVADGYLGKPDATAEAFDESGWFYTGDLCVREADGSVYYRSRLDDALRTRGFLVAPREIAAAVEEHPAVRSCEVVGTPHPRHGEVPVAFVILESDGEGGGSSDTGGESEDGVSADSLETFLDDRVADYKVPAAFEFVEAFPTTPGPNGEKVQKGTLRERVRDRFDS